jgi:hypothetical protein
MHEFVTTIAIAAPPEAVWNALTDAAHYRDWNPEIVQVSGVFAQGGSIGAKVKIGSGAVRDVQLKVPVFEPPSRMEWLGGMPLGLFTGRRILSVRPHGEGSEFRMVVQMSGLLSGAMVRAVGDRQKEIDAFSAALKAYAERAR